jgi:hypothetical protein
MAASRFISQCQQEAKRHGYPFIPGSFSWTDKPGRSYIDSGIFSVVDYGYDRPLACVVNLNTGLVQSFGPLDIRAVLSGKALMSTVINAFDPTVPEAEWEATAIAATKALLKAGTYTEGMLRAQQAAEEARQKAGASARP